MGANPQSAREIFSLKFFSKIVLILFLMKNAYDFYFFDFFANFFLNYTCNKSNGIINFYSLASLHVPSIFLPNHYNRVTVDYGRLRLSLKKPEKLRNRPKKFF